MSFTKTISVFAALASIFAAAATGYKLAQDNQEPNVYEERIQQLEEQLKQTRQVQQQILPQIVKLPEPQQEVQVAPEPPILTTPSQVSTEQ